MYVLIISRGYPTEKYKMNGIFEFDQAKALVKAGCKVVFAAVDMRSIRRWRKWGIERYNIEGVYVCGINIPVGRISKTILYKVMGKSLSCLYKIIVKEFGKPDILHAHFVNLGYVASKLKQQANIPLVITEHLSSIINPVISKRLYNTAIKAYRNADAVIAVSPALVEAIQKSFHIKALYVPNIADISIFTYIPRSEKTTFDFVSTGNFVYGKRMDLLIEAFHKAFRNSPHVTLTVFGDGKERSKIERLINKYQLGNMVTLMGRCSREIIAGQLRNSDCFVLPSRSETFGVAYIEALAAGIPVIATKCGGPEGFVHEENGILIPIDDLDSLVNAMKYMYKNSMKFDREKISRETQHKFSPERIAEKLIEVYKDMII